MNKMFCFQCQETAGCSGCTINGVCGKKAATANLQDLLIYTTKGISEVTTNLRKENKEVDVEVNRIIRDALFTTITNANFDDKVILNKVKSIMDIKEELISKLDDRSVLSEYAVYYSKDEAELREKSENVGVLDTENEDIRSLRELIIYGLKGMAAYLKHASVLGFENSEIDAFLQKALTATTDDNLTLQDLIDLTMETGKFGVDSMALLDNANTTSYGNPEITKVNIGVRNNPAILVSGHDLKDMEQLLKQTEGTGVGE